MNETFERVTENGSIREAKGADEPAYTVYERSMLPICLIE
jgi:hypothetical protein